MEWTKIATIVTEKEPLPSTELPNIPCPECGAETITFSFSVKKKSSPTDSFYITCRTCRGLEQYMHFSIEKYPKGFAEHLINPYYQRIEDWVQSKNLLQRITTSQPDTDISPNRPVYTYRCRAEPAPFRYTSPPPVHSCGVMPGYRDYR